MKYFPWGPDRQLVSYLPREDEDVTKEQDDLKARLVAEYGEVIFKQAVELSGLAMCMAGMASDDLEPEERARLYQQGSLHLSHLLNTVLPPHLTAKVTECAKRMDAAMALWMADEIERREGLPPA